MQSAVLRLHVVRPSVCDVGGSGPHRLEILEINCTDTSVREYVFFVFFRFQKNMTFYVFFEMTLKKRKKSVAKILSSLMLTLLQRKEKSLLNVYRNFGLKTPDVVGT